MRIERINVYSTQLPVKNGVYRMASADVEALDSTLVEIVTDDGLAGWGETCPIGPVYQPHHALGARAAIAEIAPGLIGSEIASIRLLARQMDERLNGHGYAKAAFDMAFLDLLGQKLGVPVSTLLGGRLTDSVPTIGPVVGIDAPDAMARLAAQAAHAGYVAIKMKIGETIAADVARVAAVREAIGPAVRLRVDANDHYRPADAISVIRAIERYDVEHVEQPIPRGDFLGLAEVRRATGVKLMTDDAVATPQDAMTVARLGAADRVKVKVTKHGLDGALTIIGMLEAAGIACVLGHVFECGLAAVAEAQLAACARNLVAPHEIGSMQPMGVTSDILVENIRPEPGFIRLPDGPGLGVRVDWAAIERMRAGRAAA